MCESAVAMSLADVFIAEKERNHEKEKAIVVFSGGQDSTTCLLWALKEFEEVETVTFHYNQRHSQEIEVAKSIAEKLGVKTICLICHFKSACTECPDKK